jgi:chromate transporter
VVALNAAVTAWTETEIVWVFVLSGLVTLIARALPRFRPAPGAAAALLFTPTWPVSGLFGPAPLSMLAQIGWFFAKAGSVVFGSGLAVVPFLYGGVVQRFHWLTEQQFLDAIAVSMITPGPVVITVAFIGYLVAGPLGATAAAIGIFLPVYLGVVLIAPYFRRLAENRQLRAFVDGVTAAATGAILGAVFVLGRRALVDVATVAIFVVTLVLILRARRLPEPLIILAAGAVGLALKGFASMAAVR